MLTVFPLYVMKFCDEVIKVRTDRWVTLVHLLGHGFEAPTVQDKFFDEFLFLTIKTRHER